MEFGDVDVGFLHLIENACFTKNSSRVLHNGWVKTEGFKFFILVVAVCGSLVVDYVLEPVDVTPTWGSMEGGKVSFTQFTRSFASDWVLHGLHDLPSIVLFLGLFGPLLMFTSGHPLRS